jgi:hypothetical protein
MTTTSRSRCTVTTWLAGGGIEAITATGKEATDVGTTGMVDAVGPEAVDTDEDLILATITKTKAICVGYMVHLGTSNPIYSVAVIHVL